MATRDPRSPAGSVIGEGVSRRGREPDRREDREEHLKMGLPETFDGTPGKYRQYILQCEMYLAVRKPVDGPTSRVMWAMSLLRGAAAVWAEGIITDYFENGESERKLATNRTMNEWVGYKSELKAATGDPISERTAAVNIRNLKQKTSAARYAAEFKRIAVNLDWEEEALRDAFWIGLKKSVKDELYKEDWAEYDEFIERAIRIDAKNYAYQMESKGYVSTPWAKGNHKKQEKASKPYYGPQPMELDEIRAKKWGYKNKKPGAQGKAKDKSQVECYACHKKGHYKSECQTGRPKKSHPKKPPPQEAKTEEVKTKEVEHDHLHWSACYEDYCPAHENGKEDAGYYPKPPKKERICALIHNEGEDMDYDTEPDHPSDMEDPVDKYETEAQLPKITEEMSGTEVEKESESEESEDPEESEGGVEYPDLEERLREANRRTREMEEQWDQIAEQAEGITWRSHPKAKQMWQELGDAREALEEERDSNKIWEQRYKMAQQHLEKAMIGGDTTVWKELYRELQRTCGAPSLSKKASEMAERLDRVIKINQVQQGSIVNLAQKDWPRNKDRDYEKERLYAQIWADVNKRYDRNQWQDMIAEVNRIIRVSAVGEAEPRDPEDYGSFIQEVPPLGCMFTTEGGYVTPGNGYIKPGLRKQFQTLKRLYREENPRKNSAKTVDPKTYKYVGGLSKNE
jgi:Retrotransposon gag protein